MAPLIELLKKSKQFKWTERCQASFDLLKPKITKATVMILPYVVRPFTIYMDVSGVAIGAILTQDGKVVAYKSRRMNAIKQRYPIYD